MRIIGGQNKGTKLNTLEGDNTRPTLDRVKESLFNIINFKLEEAVVLDLFSGSGALGLEALSRGANKTVFCDNSDKAINVIKQNVLKTRNEEKSIILKKNYANTLEYLKESKLKLDVIFLDPPYESDFYYKSLELIKEYELLNDEGIIILETDNKERIIDCVDTKYYDIYDIRRYGRVYLIFLNRKG